MFGLCRTASAVDANAHINPSHSEVQGNESVSQRHPILRNLRSSLPPFLAQTIGFYGMCSDEVLRAARRGDLDRLNYLVAIGTNINRVNKNKVSPLMIACKRGDLDFVNRLIVLGADIHYIRPYDDNVLVENRRLGGGERRSRCSLLTAHCSLSYP